MASWTEGRRPLLAGMALAGAAVWLLVWKPAGMANVAAWNQAPPSTLALGSTAPEFPPPSAKTVWINSPPLTMRGLRGDVVMIDFWEYTCINCIRTFPETKLWYERYHPYGFEVIGVHDPEFPFAYPPANVQAAARRFGLTYPIVVDDGRLIWNAYNNDVWPNRFLIDAKGKVRFNVEGEGSDHAFEAEIQKLLLAAHPGLHFPSDIALVPQADEFAPGCGTTTPEMYVGNWEGRGVLASKPGYHDGKTQTYTMPRQLADGRVGLAGAWEAQPEGMIYRGGGGAGDGLVMVYHAREIYAVLSLAAGATSPVRVYIGQDGHALAAGAAGADVHIDAKGQSYLDVEAPRMYYLAVNGADGSHQLELHPAAPGVMVSSFTFGNNCMTQFAHQ